MTTRIEVHDIGPVTEFEYEFTGPGLHILRGSQGSGKTTILRTVQLGVDGRTDVKPQKRDGTPRGEARVGGKRLRIAKQVREEGELGVEGLGDLDIAALHTPKYLDAATRDKHRIKTLVRLCGVRADASLFHDLLADESTFNEIVPTDSLETDDLVEMAARVKRAIEKEALRTEDREKTERANARAQAATVEGVDLTVETDEAALQAAWREAVEEHAALKRQRSDADEVIARAAKAREQLADLQVDGKSVAQLETDFNVARARSMDAHAEVERLRRELEHAELVHTAACDAMGSAAELLDQAKRNAQLTDGWQKDIDAAEQVACPTDEELRLAAEAETAASAAVTRGTEARRALAARDKATAHMGEADALATRARRLRDAAQDTARVLTDAIARIPHSPLRVRLNDSGDPRLVLETDRSEHEAFDELSDGERWPIIIQLAAAKNRLIVLPQAAYGELSPKTRADLDALARVHGCYILTAVADDGELRGEAFRREAEAAE